ncbi:MAG: hypothetical protein M3160_00455 [Candidatus Eremiobacteraeota bacterium]|nr:hypothetical protein [Candidatus Eremiobacteraeota bacterium]
MSLEILSTLASFATFVVIAATAIAAIVQLRHTRGSNQIAAITELRETMESAEFQATQNFVMSALRKTLEDPVFRYQILNRPARTSENQTLIGRITTVGNYYDGIGVLVKAGFVDRGLTLECFADNICDAWDMLAPVEAIFRRGGNVRGWANFEYLTVLAQDWLAAHPNGTYPPGVRRIEVKDVWRNADAQYSASLATA